MSWISIGALLTALAVIAGAFGAHALKDRLTDAELATWHTAVLYQLVHSLGIVLYGLFARDRKPRETAPWLFLFGIVLFSGSLYGLALGGPRWWGGITPIGGVNWIAGWLLFAWEARRRVPN